MSRKNIKHDVIEMLGETNPVNEVVGGVPTTNFPDCCAVGWPNDYRCSGTLIAPNLVITVQHCLNMTHVFIGGNDVLEPHRGQTIAISQQYEHTDVDLRLLVLAEEAQDIVPRHIAQGAEVGTPTEAVVVGFGTTNPNGTEGYGIKRMARVPIKSLTCSGSNDSEIYGCKPGKELVAGYIDLDIDTCSGDSGGPLYIKAQNSNEYYLLGATSRGAKNAVQHCGDGGIYVRVDYYVDWIQQVTGINIPNAK
ncbi:MAG: trypsin-like serine protease [Chloroflexota bacterium]